MVEICFSCNRRDNPEEGTMCYKCNHWICFECVRPVGGNYACVRCLSKKRKNNKNKSRKSNNPDKKEILSDYKSLDSKSSDSKSSADLSSVDNFIDCSSNDFSELENVSVDLFTPIDKITNKYQQKAIIETNTKYFELLMEKEKK